MPGHTGVPAERSFLTHRADVDDVARRDRHRRLARLLRDEQPAAGVDARGGARQHAADRQLDPDRLAEGRAQRDGMRRAGRCRAGSGSARKAAYQRSSWRSIASSSASRATSAPSTSSDVAGRPVGDTGSASAGVATLRPMPITTADSSGDCSARMPASLRSPDQDVVRPLERARRRRSRTARRTRPRPRSAAAASRAGRGGTERRPQQHRERQRRAGQRSTQDRPSRPRPAVCSSATSTWPSARRRGGPREQVGVGGAGRPRPRATSTGRRRRPEHCHLGRPAPRAAPASSAPAARSAPISRRWRCAAGGSPCPCSRPSRPRCGRPGTWTPRGCRRRPAGRGRRCPRSAPP